MRTSQEEGGNFELGQCEDQGGIYTQRAQTIGTPQTLRNLGNGRAKELTTTLMKKDLQHGIVCGTQRASPSPETLKWGKGGGLWELKVL